MKMDKQKVSRPAGACHSDTGSEGHTRHRDEARKHHTGGARCRRPPAVGSPPCGTAAWAGPQIQGRLALASGWGQGPWGAVGGCGGGAGFLWETVKIVVEMAVQPCKY